MEKANQKLKSLLALWEDKRRGRLMPSRNDLPVTTLKSWLGNLALIDIANGLPATFRLCGTNLHKRFDGEVTKRAIRSLEPAIVAALEKCIAEVALDRKPRNLVYQGKIDGETLTFHEMCLPLSDDATSVQTILFVSYLVTTKGKQP